MTDKPRTPAEIATDALNNWALPIPLPALEAANALGNCAVQTDTYNGTAASTWLAQLKTAVDAETVARLPNKAAISTEITNRLADAIHPYWR